MEKRFLVDRWCCTGGNCTRCNHLGFGLNQRMRVVQILTDDEGTAEKTTRNWHEYGAKMIDRKENK